MKSFTAIIEKCQETGLYVGNIPGFPGAHSQAASLDELHQNLTEVVEMLLEDEEPQFESEFVGTQTIFIA